LCKRLEDVLAQEVTWYQDGIYGIYCKPWYEVVKPREDLRDSKPLDASEFAVHLDQVRDGRAHDDYRRPERFFAKTVLTANLVSMAGEVVRRLSGIKTQEDQRDFAVDASGRHRSMRQER
jgi:hypothetical protein